MYYNLGNQKKLQCLHSIMGSDTKRFYRNSAQPHMNTYTHAVELVIQEYKSAVRKYRVKNVLSRLRICKKLEENQDEGEALAKVQGVQKKPPIFKCSSTLLSHDGLAKC